MTGRSLPHVMMMMIPEPWSHHETMPDEKRAFYEYHANLLEPWDGPAAMGFCDGFLVGAVLDRNGLRPGRYYVTTDEWARRLIAEQAADDQFLYLQVTRGVAMRDHVMPVGVEPTVFMMSNPMKPVPADLRHQGVACVSARDVRWERGDLKCTSLMGNVLARQISADVGAAETILFRDGAHGGPWLTEGASSNVWIVHEGAMLGPLMNEHVLEGIRVGLLRELCDELGIAFNLRPISEADVRAADEILLSSSGKEVLAVTRLDGDLVGHGALRGKPGPVYGRLYEAYQGAKREQSI
jgi:D-alanine transaminase